MFTETHIAFQGSERFLVQINPITFNIKYIHIKFNRNEFLQVNLGQTEPRTLVIPLMVTKFMYPKNTNMRTIKCALCKIV